MLWKMPAVPPTADGVKVGSNVAMVEVMVLPADACDIAPMPAADPTYTVPSNVKIVFALLNMVSEPALFTSS